MYPILARYGPFLIYSYEVVVGTGILISLGLAYWLGRREGPSFASRLDGLLFMLPLALIGGRAIFVLSESSYYLENPGEIWLLWRGGINYHGTLAAGLVGIWIWSRWRQHHFHDYAGILATSLAVMSVFGWLACWFDGCAYGREASAGILVGDLPDSFGVYALRYQTQLIGIILSLAALATIAAVFRRQSSLQLFWFALGLISLVHLLIGFYRGDQATMIGGYRLDTLADAGLILLSMGGLVVAKMRKRRLTANGRVS